jgi:hypothetical protein
MAAVIVHQAKLADPTGHSARAVHADLWMVWDCVEERTELIALLNGQPYPPTGTGRP